MRKLSHAEWREWQNHPVTEALSQAILESLDKSLEQLADPDSDEKRDMFLKGKIWAFRDVLDAKPALLDEVFEEEKANEV